MRTALALGLTLLALVAAGCGDDDGGDDGGGGSVAEAKQALIDSCHKGHEGDDRDLKLCQCIADQLEKKHGHDTAKKFDDTRKSVEEGDVPPEVRSSVSAPDCQATQQQ
jgi:hypothetical protein